MMPSAAANQGNHFFIADPLKATYMVGVAKRQVKVQWVLSQRIRATSMQDRRSNGYARFAGCTCHRSRVN